MQTSQLIILLAAGFCMFAVIGGLAMLAHYYTLDGIKSRTVGVYQSGHTARMTPAADH